MHRRTCQRGEACAGRAAGFCELQGEEETQNKRKSSCEVDQPKSLWRRRRMCSAEVIVGPAMDSSPWLQIICPHGYSPQIIRDEARAERGRGRANPFEHKQANDNG